jgi:hypothetical protein
MKPGQIRPLYLEPRLHKQSVKQEIIDHGTCLAKPLLTWCITNTMSLWTQQYFVNLTLCFNLFSCFNNVAFLTKPTSLERSFSAF